MTALRRRLLGGAAALVLAAPAAAPAASADAALLALAGRFLAMEAVHRRSIDDEGAAETAGDIDAADAAAAVRSESNAEYLELLTAIAGTPARTADGRLAKAEVVHAFFTPDPPYYSAVDRVAWSLILDLTGRAPA